MSKAERAEVPLEEVLLRYREGDVAAFRAFYGRTNRLLYGFLRRRLRSHGEAEDVFQDTFFRVHRYITSFDPTKGAVEWLFAIARNALYDHLKRCGTLASSEPASLESVADVRRTDELPLLKEALGQACIGLSDEEISLLADRVFEEESFAAIAKRRGLTEANARQKVGRILKRVRSGWTE